MLRGIRIAVLVGVLLVGACGPGEEELLRSFTAEWRGEEVPGGMRIRLDEEGGILVGLRPDGSVQDTMRVAVTRIDTNARTAHLRRLETDAEFTVQLVGPGEEGRSRIRLRFPNGRQLNLIFRRPLPEGG